MKIALADDNSGELEKINTVLSEKQQQLVKLAHAKKDYTALADEIDLLRDKKQGLLVAKAETEGFKKRIKELEDFLKAANHELTEYDESMVRKYIEKIKVYEDKFYSLLQSRCRLGYRAIRNRTWRQAFELPFLSL